MPSTHSAVISFYATCESRKHFYRSRFAHARTDTCLAATYLPLHRSIPDLSVTRTWTPLLALIIAAIVAGSRVWNGHHTWPQVSVGCAYGTTFAFIGMSDLREYHP